MHTPLRMRGWGNCACAVCDGLGACVWGAVCSLPLHGAQRVVVGGLRCPDCFRHDIARSPGLLPPSKDFSKSTGAKVTGLSVMGNSKMDCWNFFSGKFFSSYQTNSHFVYLMQLQLTRNKVFLLTELGWTNGISLPAQNDGSSIAINVSPGFALEILLRLHSM